MLVNNVDIKLVNNVGYKVGQYNVGYKVGQYNCWS